MTTIEHFAKEYRLRVTRDSCNDPIIAGRQSNEECARIILADPERYPAGSLLAIWAELVLNPPEPPRRPAA